LNSCISNQSAGVLGRKFKEHHSIANKLSNHCVKLKLENLIVKNISKTCQNYSRTAKEKEDMDNCTDIQADLDQLLPASKV
jgi:hypothetical protein